MTAKLTSHHHPKLAQALAWDRGPICIEIDPDQQPAACIRTSNSLSLLELTPAEAAGTLGLLAAAGLDPTGRRSGWAWLEIDGQAYRANMCPQFHGTIVTLHRKPGDGAAAGRAPLPVG